MVGEKGTISAAAEMMGLTGPAVHNQLKTLEEIVGSPVILREGRQRNAATPQGLVLQRAEAEIRATLERAMRNIAALESGKSGSVVLGVASTAKYFAPRIVALLERDLPEFEVQLNIGNRSETIAKLGEGVFDLCIMGRPPRQPVTVSEPLADNPHVIIAAPTHPLSARDRVGPAELLSERFVLREEGAGTRVLAVRFLANLSGGRPVRTIDMDSNETIKQAVMSGLGIALISVHAVADELATGYLTALPVTGTPILRKWYVLTPSEFAPTGAALRVRDWLTANQYRYIPRFDPQMM